jgi:hypothetical protein
MVEIPMGSGGLSITPRMSALIALAGTGVLPTFVGGQELRGWYKDGQYIRSIFIPTSWPTHAAIFPTSHPSAHSWLA